MSEEKSSGKTPFVVQQLLRTAAENATPEKLPEVEMLRIELMHSKLQALQHELHAANAHVQVLVGRRNTLQQEADKLQERILTEYDINLKTDHILPDGTVRRNAVETPK